MPKQDKSTERLKMDNLSTNKTGAMSELMACAWLLKQGYEVYRNTAPDGLFDIVIYDKQKKSFLGIDVKTSKNNKKYYSHPKNECLANENILLVDTNTGQVGFATDIGYHKFIGVKRICPYCSKSFIAKDGFGIYCSNNCGIYDRMKKKGVS